MTLNADSTRSAFLKVLFDLAGATDSSSQPGSAELLKAFLAFGSESPDNLLCAEHVEFGPVPGPNQSKTYSALKIRGKDIGLSGILNHAEGSRMPSAVRTAFPELTQREWEAALRMVTMVLLALERQLDE